MVHVINLFSLLSLSPSNLYNILDSVYFMSYEIPVKLPSDAERERLVLLIEECSEVQKQACKILRFGWKDIHPITKVDNKTILEEELGDLDAVIDLFHLNGEISISKISEAYQKKQEKLKKFTLFQGL